MYVRGVFNILIGKSLARILCATSPKSRRTRGKKREGIFIPNGGPVSHYKMCTTVKYGNRRKRKTTSQEERAST